MRVEGLIAWLAVRKSQLHENAPFGRNRAGNGPLPSAGNARTLLLRPPLAAGKGIVEGRDKRMR